MADHMRTELVVDALTMTASQRGGATEGIIFHGDRGSPIPLGDYRQLVTDLGMVQSVVRTGVCWDCDQRTGRDDQRALQSRVRLRPRRQRLGRRRTTSSWPPSPGCTDSTSSGCTATATTCLRLSSKQPSTRPNRPTPSGLESNSLRLDQTQDRSNVASPRDWYSYDPAAGQHAPRRQTTALIVLAMMAKSVRRDQLST